MSPPISPPETRPMNPLAVLALAITALNKFRD